LGFKLTNVLKNNASSKETNGKIPKQTLKCQQKVTKMPETVKERVDKMNTPTRFPIRPLEVNAVQIMILISVAELQNLHAARTEFLIQNST
jgi:hypothetical protein